MAESRFNQKKANLRAYLRKRGAKIDTSRKTVSVDVDSLNWKEMERLKELERWGYKVNEGKIPPPQRYDLTITKWNVNHSLSSLMRLYRNTHNPKTQYHGTF